MIDRNGHDDIERETFAEWVPIADMFCAPYQRPASAFKLRGWLQTFDAKKLGVIMLSMRDDGRYAILDGNHRAQLAQRRGITHMAARVFIDLTYHQEAELYEAFNTVNRPTPLDKFRSRLERRELQATEIDGILRKHGMHVGVDDRSKTAVLAVIALDKTYTDLGPAGLYEVVNILHRAWGTEPTAWSGRIISALRQFWMRYRSEADANRVVEKLQRTNPNAL